MKHKRLRNTSIQNANTNSQIPVSSKQKIIHAGRLIFIVHLSIDEHDELLQNDLPTGINVMKKLPRYTKYYSISTETETIVYLFFKILVQVDINMQSQIDEILKFVFLQKKYVHDVVLFINKTTKFTYIFNESLSKSINKGEDYSNVSIISTTSPNCPVINQLSKEYSDFIDNLDDDVLEDENMLIKHIESLSNIIIPTIPPETRPFRKNINVSFSKTKKNQYIWGPNKLYLTLNINCDFASSSKYILDQWWIKEILQQPPCAYGRLRQYTGTCWFNTILHSMILAPILSSKLLDMWKNYNKTDRETSLIIKNITFPYGWTENVDDTNRLQFLYYIIYNMLDVKVRPDYQSDIPTALADTCNLIARKTSASIDIIIRTMFPTSAYIANIIGTSPISEAFSNYQIVKPDSRTITFNDDVLENKTLYEILLFKFHKKYIKISQIPKIIKIESTTYTLDCGGLRPRHNHAISGIICNDSKYSSFIYDSHNILVITDWFDGNLGNYYAQTTQPQEANYPDFTYAIYIRLV